MNSFSPEAHDFLRSRRDRLTPDAAGIVPFGGMRRVPGLRREEVAMLAGMSVDYYNRLERGDLSGASEEVLDALARALHLDPAEKEYLFDLARAARGRAPRRKTRTAAELKPSVARILNSMSVPAFVRNGRMDILGMNDLSRALYERDGAGTGQETNFARYLFLNPDAPDEIADWEDMARDTVAILRHETGRDPNSRELHELIGELTTKSAPFRVMWSAHNVRFHRSGRKSFHHPAVGEFELSFDAMELPGQDGLTLIAYSAEPNTTSAQALTLLAAWVMAPREPQRRVGS